MTLTNTATGPHAGQPILTAGAALESAQAAMIMTHGRGGNAADILTLIEHIDRSDFAYFAPQAAGNTWYPLSFLSPTEQNEPNLSSALETLEKLLAHINQAGIPPEKTILLGFSQGACLSVEFAARHARRYGGLAILSGGLIGPNGAPRDYAGSLEGTPIFLGCSEADFHIPRERVHESTKVLQGMEAEVTERLYPGMGHTIIQDEIDFVKAMMARVGEL